MRILFMGTPDFAVPSLERLIENGFEVCGVFTQPDKPKGRGHKLQMPPVKEAALRAGIPVYQPVTLRDGEALSLLTELKPDLILVVAYGKILPKEILELPPFGCVNVHGSLLPLYRGAAPIQHAVLDGRKTTGITIMYMAEGMDTGDMLLKREVEIGENETTGELFDRLKWIGADLLLEAIPGILSGSLQPERQCEEEATYAPMITKEMAEIHWDQPASRIKNQIRGLNPWPCAYTRLEGKKIKVFSAELLEGSGEPGRLFEQEGALCVYCGEKALSLGEIQPENGKRMDGASYLLGHPIQETSCFETEN